MNPPSDERFYNLLPKLYHRRDLENGEPLRALLAMLESEYQTLEADMAATYNNWFIQTCDDWVVPYLADLVGIGDLKQTKHIFSTQRRQVANTIRYRRLKGTLPVLEHVLRDVTGWMIRAVEFSQGVGITQDVRHVQPGPNRMIDLQNPADLAELGGASAVAHTIDLHSTHLNPEQGANRGNRRQGKYGLNNLGLYIWRLRSYPMKYGLAHAAHKTDRPARYTFDPLGRDIPLFNFPQFISVVSQRAQAQHMPLRLTRELLAADLEAYEMQYQNRSPDEQPANSTFYGPDRGLYVILPDRTPIAPIEVVSMNLSQWETLGQFPEQDSTQGFVKKVGIDATLGRLVFLSPNERAGQEIKVHYCYGLSDELGGGPYRRDLAIPDMSVYGFQLIVAKGTVNHTLEQALKAWEAYCATHSNPTGIIKILDNGAYGGRLTVRLPKGAQLAIVADNAVRPAITTVGDLTVTCDDSPTLNPASDTAALVLSSVVGIGGKASVEQKRTLTLDGLLIVGGVQIVNDCPSAMNELLTLKVQHCTLMPNGFKATGADNPKGPGILLNIDHSIVGPIHLSAAVTGLSIVDSIIDNGSGYAIAGDSKGKSPAPVTVMNRVTVFGKVSVTELRAMDVLFRDPLNTAQITSETRDQIAYCYVPPGSTTLNGEPHAAITADLDSPEFTSTRFGDPGYAQLSEFCPRAILRAGSDESEIGVFHDQYQLQAEDNLQSALDEYLPYGLQVGIFYMT